MIETCSAYKVGNETFSSLDEAQIAAIQLALYLNQPVSPEARATIQHLVAQKAEVLSILTMSEPKERTRKPRSDRGKKHKAATAPEPELPGVKVEASSKYAGK